MYPLPNKLTLEEARELFRYDEESGTLFWRKSRGTKQHQAGEPVKLHNIPLVNIKKERILAHRIIWLLKTGEWPKKEIDHRDGNPRNNKWENLREATHSQNTQNRKMKSDCEAGLKGAHKSSRNWWVSSIMVRGKIHRLGKFSSPQKAHEAYAAAAVSLHGDFARIA